MTNRDGLRTIPNRSDSADRIVHHLEMAIVAARGTGTAAFFEHVERARALCIGVESVSTPPGALAPWQRRHAEELLVASVEGGISVEEIAAACGLSRGHFTRAFTKTVGMPPRAWLLARRVEAAQRLMRERGSTLSQVAAATGFADQSHLSRTFKRVTGMSPTEFRRTVREGGSGR